MKWVAIISLVLGVLTGIVGQGSFGHHITVILAAIYVGVPVALFIALWLILGLVRNRQIPAKLPKFLEGFLIAGASLVISFGIGAAIHHWEIRQTRAYVEHCVPLLDAYMEKHGEYPASLAELNVSVPLFLSDEFIYCADADQFTFTYWDEVAMMDGYIFQSSSRTWIRFD